LAERNQRLSNGESCHYSMSTPLLGAIWRQDLAKVRLLLEYGASVDGDTVEGDDTPLDYAISEGNLPLMHLLLEQGANPDGRDRKGRSALSRAEEAGDEEYVRLLRQAGAQE